MEKEVPLFLVEEEFLGRPCVQFKLFAFYGIATPLSILVPKRSHFCAWPFL